MAITGIGNNYNNMYEGTYAAQKNETSKKADTKEAASAQAGDTKKAGTDSVSDYYSYLQKNYVQRTRGRQKNWKKICLSSKRDMKAG